MISVIIPVYNVEDYLHDCINSILNQSFQDFEIICVDDCSTDSSLKILNEFAKKDNRIKIVRNEVNSSLGFSRNHGLEYAKGKYVLFLDSDDWLDSKSLEILYNTAEKDNLEVLMFKLINFDDEKKIFYRDNYYDMPFMNPYLNKIFNYHDLKANEITRMSVNAVNKLFLRSFICENNLRFPVGLIHEDNPFFYQMLHKAKRISLIDYHFYNRRRRMGSITTRNGKEVLDVIEIVNLCIRVSLDDKQLYEKHKCTFLNRMFRSFVVKYNFIDDLYKDEFKNKSKELINNLCSEYPGLLNDLSDCLDEENYKFFDFMMLGE
ncbi:glycosyltransferase family 2 protein [uncultured Methanobrevibacter sp.]|uniref:glycosyltransferase family 2 protein n=1 Tax=uncultured Methanobrevibacter sp. TaxID=253161 RepID=UPI0032083B09